MFYVARVLAAFDASTIAWLLLSFLGGQLLARRFGLSSAGAFTLAAGWALHPFVVYRVPQGIPTHLASLAFVPWVWLAADNCGSGFSVLGSGLLALVLSLQGLSGHPQFMVINLAGLALYLALARPRALIPLAGALAAAAVLTAAQWVPTAQYLARSVRSEWSPLFASAYSLPASWLKLLVDPHAQGSPLEIQYEGYPSEFFEMAGLYGGLVPLALSAWGLYFGRRRGALIALLALGLFLAFGGRNPMLKALLQLPGLGSLRVPARWVLLMIWGLWLAACAGCRDALARPEFRHLRPGLLAAVIAVLTAADLTAWDAKFLYRDDATRYLVSSPMVQRLRVGGQRYATGPDVPNPNKGMLYRLPNVTGYEAFYLAGAATYAAGVQHQASADGSHTYIRDPFAFKGAALRWYLDGKSLTEVKDARALAYEQDGPDAAVETPDAEHWNVTLPQRSGTGPAIGDMRSGPVHPNPPPVNGRRETGVILAQADYPGWKAWSGEREVPIARHDDFLQRISVDSDAPVHLRFDPGLWSACRWLSALAVAAAAALLWSGARRLRFI